MKDLIEEKNKLAKDVHRLLLERVLHNKFTGICFGESFTGGRIMSALTQYQGSSKYMLGGIVFYHPNLKFAIGVPENINIVSEECAKISAKKVLEWFQKNNLNPEIAISATGRAEKGGRFYIGLASKTGSTYCLEKNLRHHNFTRNQVQELGVIHALRLVLDYLRT